MDAADAILSTLSAKTQLYRDAAVNRSRNYERISSALGGTIEKLGEYPSLVKKKQEEDDEKSVSDAFTSAMASHGDPEVAMDTIAQLPTRTAAGARAKATLGLKLENTIREREISKASLQMKQQELKLAEERGNREQSAYDRKLRQAKVFSKFDAFTHTPMYSGYDKDPNDIRKPKAKDVISYLQASGEFTPDELSLVGTRLFQEEDQDEKLRLAWQTAADKDENAKAALKAKDDSDKESRELRWQMAVLTQTHEDQRAANALGMKADWLNYIEERDTLNRMHEDDRFAVAEKGRNERAQRRLDAEFSRVGSKLDPATAEKLKWLRTRATRTFGDELDSLEKEYYQIVADAEKAIPQTLKAPASGEPSEKVKRILELIRGQKSEGPK